MRFGLPRVITSDQGREFNNELNHNLCQILGIKHRLTSPYHPQVCMSFNVHWLLVSTIIPRYIAGKWPG